MQVLYEEDLASRIDPEPCTVPREGQSEASAGKRAGWPLSRVRPLSRMPTSRAFPERQFVNPCPPQEDL